MSSDFFSPNELVSTLRSESRSLGLPEGSIEPIIERVLKAVLTWLENREIITRSDLERVVSSELKKYSPDLALVYENREKVI
ncbi:hypothetical protein IKE71_00655 [Candidatus Saccharibacteria bacterium]|nr:hypothetical protein [Candidatus Saccharibacteria bacterium]